MHARLQRGIPGIDRGSTMTRPLLHRVVFLVAIVLLVPVRYSAYAAPDAAGSKQELERITREMKEKKRELKRVDRKERSVLVELDRLDRNIQTGLAELAGDRARLREAEGALRDIEKTTRK